jgi:SAM-dependent methyltransferase
MKHEYCGGIIIEKYRSQLATDQFLCLKCGKFWGVVSDLSDIDITDSQRQKIGHGSSSNSRSYEFHRVNWHANVPSSVISWFFNERLRRTFKLITPTKERCAGLDIGCSHGYTTQHLAQRLNGVVIGVDLNRSNLYRAKTKANLRMLHMKSASDEAVIEYVRCDINHLPFKRGSITSVLCVSVIEHLSNLRSAIGEIKDTLKEKGQLIIGYPIETRLFMTLMKLFLPSGLAYRNPKIWGKGFESSPDTHKQSYTVIRSVLTKNFCTIKREKFPITLLPDEMCWYECLKMQKVDQLS